MDDASGSPSCTSVLMPESKLSQKTKAQYGFITKLIHHGGKNIGSANLKNKERLLVIDYWLTNTLNKKVIVDVIVEKCFSCFFFLKTLISERYVMSLLGKWWKPAYNQIHNNDRTKGTKCQSLQKGFLRFLLTTET